MVNMKKAILKEMLDYYIGKDTKKQESFIFEQAIYDWMQYHRINIVYGDYVMTSYRNVDDADKAFFVKQKEEAQIKNNMQLSILRKVDKKLNDYQISYILLKGMAVANTCYQEFSHRVFDDIDILIDYSVANKVTKALKELNYVQGYYWEKKIHPAARKDILHQQLYTHELFNMVKLYGDFESNIDINHKFGWLGIDGKKYKKIEYENLYAQTDVIEIGDRKYKVFNPNLNFVHLCCHYYNSAVYFALDNDYKFDDPKELCLNRLFDIVLLLSQVNLDTINKISSKLNVEKEVKFVMTIIKSLFNNSYGFDVFDTNEVVMSIYYTSTLQECYWPIDLETRIFDIEKKNNAISAMKF